MFEAKLVPHGGHHVDFQRTDRARRSVAGSEIRPKKWLKVVFKAYLYHRIFFLILSEFESVENIVKLKECK